MVKVGGSSSVCDVGGVNSVGGQPLASWMQLGTVNLEHGLQQIELFSI
jgi:hypothetical protein